MEPFATLKKEIIYSRLREFGAPRVNKHYKTNQRKPVGTVTRGVDRYMVVSLTMIVVFVPSLNPNQLLSCKVT
jgi:hypothetical protein